MHSSQSLASILLAAFSLVYCENGEKNSEQMHFKNLQLGQKSAHRTEAKEDILIEQITALKEMLSSLQKHSKKEA